MDRQPRRFQMTSLRGFFCCEKSCAEGLQSWTLWFERPEFLQKVELQNLSNLTDAYRTPPFRYNMTRPDQIGLPVACSRSVARPRVPSKMISVTLTLLQAWNWLKTSCSSIAVMTSQKCEAIKSGHSILFSVSLVGSALKNGLKQLREDFPAHNSHHSCKHISVSSGIAYRANWLKSFSQSLEKSGGVSEHLTINTIKMARKVGNRAWNDI